MRILIEALKVTHLPWPETLVLQSKDKVDCDPSDGKLPYLFCAARPYADSSQI